MKEEKSTLKALVYPALLAAALLLIWGGLSAKNILPHDFFPTPIETAHGIVSEFRHGGLADNITISLYRVAVAFVLAALVGVPLGLLMGAYAAARLSLLPYVNFFRSISPIAWMGFALLWFAVGDPVAIFLIFQSAFWQLALGTFAATSAVPAVYYRVARDYQFSPLQVVTRITFPAILPQLLTNLRVTMGLVWTVVVPAEMLAGKGGLGFAIQDDRNAVRPDLLVVHMIVIGIIGVILDRLIARLTRRPNVRWGYAR